MSVSAVRLRRIAASSVCAVLGLICAVTVVQGEETSEQEARSTAIALNYCRASFHRLRGNPSKRVLFEEQQHILNNLNLNGIADQEVITLYSSVLDEIGRERIADKEREVIAQGYRRAVREQLVSRAFVLGTEIGTAQYVGAVRTGASGWWDYRSSGLNRDLDLWKVDRNRMLEVNGKSSAFLDTFWKMAQRKRIPDRWLVRGDDLDKLEQAVAEANPEVRLRVLQRMERYLECYPPYWYHVARTQQGLGQLFAAAETYARLEQVASGHFRKDEMLATALANRAMIQAYLRQPGAAETAHRALEYSNGVWQANLVCARVLEQDGEIAAAEDAILRNLDVDLEQAQSQACLVSLYCHEGYENKLVERLNDPRLVAELPTAILLRCAAQLGTERFPAPALRQVAASLYAIEQPQYGRTQIVIYAAPSWEIDQASAVLTVQGTDFGRGRLMPGRDGTYVQFSGTPGQRQGGLAGDEMQLEIRYPDAPPVKLQLRRQPWSRDLVDHVAQQTPEETFPVDLQNLFGQKRRVSYLISNAEFGDAHVAVNGGEPTPTSARPATLQRIQTNSPVQEDPNGEDPIDADADEPPAPAVLTPEIIDEDY